MKYTIFGVALAFSLGANAQTAGPAAADLQAGTSGSAAQAANPVAADSQVGTTGDAAPAASPVAPQAGTTGGTAQTATPVAVDSQAATTGGAMQTASPVAGTPQADTTSTPAQASPVAAASPADTNGGAMQAASSRTAVPPKDTTAGAPQAAGPGAIDLHPDTTGSTTQGPAAAAAPGATGGEARTASPFAVEIHAGSSGAGGQVEVVFNDYLTARVSGDWLRFSASFNAIDFETIDIAYSGRADWATVGVFADLHPFRNGWFISGGVFQGDRNASFAGAPTSDVIIEGMTFTPADIGTVMGEAKLTSTSPFVGLGWDEAQLDRSGLTFRFLAGAAFGAPKVTLWDVGPYADTGPVQTWIAQEQADAQSEADAWKAYPVVQLGIGYRF